MTIVYAVPMSEQPFDPGDLDGDGEVEIVADACDLERDPTPYQEVPPSPPEPGALA